MAEGLGKGAGLALLAVPMVEAFTFTQAQFKDDKLMHSWGFALREGVFAKPKKLYFKIQKFMQKIQKEREEGAMKRAGPAASWSYRAPEHRDYDTPSL